MKGRLLIIIGIVTLFTLLVPPVSADGWGQDVQRLEKSGPAKSKLMASAFCDGYNISGPATGPGSTNGTYGDVEVGDTFTFTATGNGSGSWRIVGEADGSITYTTGGTFPDTLTYTVTTAGSGVGVGFYVDSYTGPGDTISGVCGDTVATPAIPVPAFSDWSRALLIILLGIAALSIIGFRFRWLR